MSCHHCLKIEHHFDEAKVKKELHDYHSNGVIETTRLLIEALKRQEINGMTLLDIGGGIGGLQFALLQEGVQHAISVEASSAFLQVAKEEAKRQGFYEAIEFHHGDFVSLATSLPGVDIVTLDRTICCFDDMPALVNASLDKTAKFYGLVYPKASWWQKLSHVAQVLLGIFKTDAFTMYYHNPEAVDELIRSHGFSQCFFQNVNDWLVVVYKRD